MGEYLKIQMNGEIDYSFFKIEARRTLRDILCDVQNMDITIANAEAEIRDLTGYTDEPFCEQVFRWLNGDAPQECKGCEEFLKFNPHKES